MRAQTAVLKREIEARLANRIPAALSPLARQTPRLHPTGVAQIDALLGGGLPLGSICELTGPEGSGRSSIALSVLAGAAEEGACAYIDVSDTLSPHSAAAAGIMLSNMLWVRFAARPDEQARISVPSTQAISEASNAGHHRPIHTGCGGSHPRGETKDLAPALEQMLLYKEERRMRKMEGTPGYPNQPLGLHTASQDQVDWERWNLRKADETDPLRVMDRKAAETARQRSFVNAPIVIPRVRVAKTWDRLDRALRATDQVLQSGGFRIVILDLGSVDASEAFRVPSANWYRFRRAAQESDAILLLLTKEPCARSSAACVLECSAGEPPRVQGVLTTASHHAEIARKRSGPDFAKKAPGRAASWEAAPAWMRAAGR